MTISDQTLKKMQAETKDKLEILANKYNKYIEAHGDDGSIDLIEIDKEFSYNRGRINAIIELRRMMRI